MKPQSEAQKKIHDLKADVIELMRDARDRELFIQHLKARVSMLTERLRELGVAIEPETGNGGWGGQHNGPRKKE